MRSPRPAETGLLAALLLVAAVVPATASAREDPLRVAADSRDQVVAFASAAGADTLLFTDANGDASLDQGESVYAAPDADRLPLGAVRIAHPGNEALGSQVRSGDPGHDAPVDQLPGEIRYYDADADGAYGSDDVLFFDTDDNRQGEVDPSDVTLTGPHAGTTGQTNYGGDNLDTLRARIAWSDVHGDDTFGVGDLVAIDAGTEGDYLGIRDVPLWEASFGEAGTGDTPGVVYELSTGDAPQTFHYLDADASGQLNADEPVYLSRQGDQVTGSSILVANTGDDEPGTTAGQASGGALGTDTDPLSGTLRFADRDGSAALSLEDALYHERDDAQDFRASARDVVVTGPDAGIVVSGSYEHTGEQLVEFQAEIAYVDRNGNDQYSGGEPVFVDTDRDGVVDLSEPPVGALPSTLELRPGVRRTLSTFSATTQYGIQDSDGDGTPDHGEPLYVLPRGGNSVTEGVLRLAYPPNGSAIGSIVADGEGDQGTDLEPLKGGLSFHDADGDGRLDLEEDAYLDADGTSDVTQGDVLLSTRNATTVLGPDAPALGDLLTRLVDRLAWMDADGTGSYSTGDVLYADANGDGRVSVGDLGFRSADPDRTLDDLLTAQPPAEPEPADADGDGVADSKDNCPDTPNEDQTDSDGDGAGDACDDTTRGPDRDGDGAPDNEDNCPNTANPDQTDTDDDGEGDACEPEDSDGDGVPDHEDHCPNTENPDQADTDGDGTGDACDGDLDGDSLTNARERGLGTDPRTPDTDGDGVTDEEDNCPTIANADQADADGDGTGDACTESADEENGAPGVTAPGVAAVLAITVLATRRRARKPP